MRVFVTGGAGYVGSILVPELLKEHDVITYDMYIYRHILPYNHRLTQIIGDIRDTDKVVKYSEGCDAIIHLASTGAPGDIDIDLAKSIDYSSTYNIVKACNINSIKRLIVASSTSQYGIKPLTVSVTEEEKADPVDTYGLHKIMNEEYIRAELNNTEYVFVRPSTLCGYSPRLRLDLAVNALTISALTTGKMTVFGGSQMRPTLNVLDMVRVYKMMLTAPRNLVDSEAFNVLYSNYTIDELAQLVRGVIGNDIIINKVESDDLRSYHVNADKIKKVLGFECRYTVEDGIRSIADAYYKGIILYYEGNIYRNIPRIKEVFSC
jgi:nucleoside-diphosphate-sugar epimerase